MYQYMKKKPIHSDFKFWSCCVSKLRYLYEFDMYLGKKENTEYGIGKLLALQAAAATDRKTEIVMDIIIIFLKAESTERIQRQPINT